MVRAMGAPVASAGAPRTDGPVVIGAIILLIVLVVPIALWAFTRWLPGRQRARPPAQPKAGPRKRWWQP